MKWKSLWEAKDIVHKTKQKSTESEKSFTNPTSDRGLISKHVNLPPSASGVYYGDLQLMIKMKITRDSEVPNPSWNVYISRCIVEVGEMS